MHARVVIGVECNAAAATAVVMDEEGELIGRATGAGARMSLESGAQVVANVRDVVERALDAAGVGGSEKPGVLCAGVAGVGREQERFLLWRELFRQELAGEVVVQPDATVAVHDAFGRAPGVLVIAGVGAIAYGRDVEGRPVRCGGWGPLAGDEGGGAWIGRRALNVVTAMADGREPTSPLFARVLAAMGGKSPADILTWVSNAGLTQATALASLAPAVLAVADAGDVAARAIVQEAAAELVRLVVALAPAVSPTGAPAVACAGDLLESGSTLHRAFAAALAQRVPGAALHATEVVPARGAADLALLYLTDRGAAQQFGQVAPLARAIA